jgi:hypothetical protein
LSLSKLSTSIFEVILSGDDIVVNSKVWNEIVLVVLIHICLELLIGSSLSFQAFWEVGRVASWD